MQILKFSLGQLQANCYFLIEDDKCLIIDPADEASFILEELQRRKLKLVGMLATHGHFDHVMAAGEIQKSISVPLHLSEDDQFLIDRMKETAEYFLNYAPLIIKPTLINHLIKVKDIRKEIRIPALPAGRSNFKFQILSTPGHTPGSFSIYFSKEKAVLTGDTLFKEGIGRYDFSYSDKKKLRESIKNILELPKDTIVYPGHGEETTIANEKEFALSLF